MPTFELPVLARRTVTCNAAARHRVGSSLCPMDSIRGQRTERGNDRSGARRRVQHAANVGSTDRQIFLDSSRVRRNTERDVEAARIGYETPNRRSTTARCERHARRSYQPFQCAARAASRKGCDWPGGPALAGKVGATAVLPWRRMWMIRVRPGRLLCKHSPHVLRVICGSGSAALYGEIACAGGCQGVPSIRSHRTAKAFLPCLRAVSM